MPINPVMPETAPIEADEYNEGERQAQAPTPEPEIHPPAPAPEPEYGAGDAEERRQRAEPEPEADPEPEDAPPPDDTAAEAGKARKHGLEGRKATIQEQINALVRERGEVTRETERGRQERADLQREIEALRAEKTQATGGRPAGTPAAYDGGDPNDPEPVEGDFEDYAAYTKAIGRWAGRQEFRRGEHLRERRATMAAREQWEAKRQAGYSTRYQTFAKANPSFEQEINRDDLLLTAPMVDVIKDSEMGPQMLLHLARHSDEVARIAALHPVLAFGEMKKIEARLEGAHSGSPQQTATYSKAPAPIKPVGNVASRRSDSDDIPDEDVDVDEHIRRMNQRDELARKRGVNTRKGYGVRL